MSEGNVEDAAVQTLFGGPTASNPGLPLTVEACLFGGGDMELHLDTWNAS